MTHSAIEKDYNKNMVVCPLYSRASVEIEQMCNLVDYTANFLEKLMLRRPFQAIAAKGHSGLILASAVSYKMKIPVIAILNTDCNSKDVDFPIIANDASVSSISFFLSNVKEAYDKGLAGQTTEKKA